MFEQTVSLPMVMALCGGLLGFVLGYVARYERFCTLSAIETAYLGGQWVGVRMWMLAVSVAIIGVHLLYEAGLVNVVESFHLLPRIAWFGPVVGGLMFGLGMALVGTCGFGALLRAAGGDLRGLVVVLVLAICAYATMSGVLARLRVDAVAVTSFDLSHGTDASPAGLISHLSGSDADSFRFTVALLTAGLLAAAALAPSQLRQRPRTMLGAVIIGLVVTGGWFTTGYLGADPFDPQPVASFGFVGPTAETLMYVMTYSGSTVSFAVGGFTGTAMGGFTAAWRKQELRLDGYDDAVEMRRHLAGAGMMGAGGVISMGCTIGQGLTGVSTLALPSFLALGSMILGACIGLEWLMRDDPVTGVWERVSGMWSKERS